MALHPSRRDDGRQGIAGDPPLTGRPRDPTDDDPFSVGDALEGTGLRITAVLSRGGQATLFEAAGGGGVVAVKALRPSFRRADPGADESLRRESALLRATRHPNVVRHLGFGETAAPAREPYLLLERLYGHDLRALLDERGALPFAAAFAVAGDVAAALAHVHRAGIVHLDVKPENVFVHLDGGVARAKLLDFGVAHRIHDEPPAGSAGTPLYASPEQLRGAAVGPASDVFAWGLLLWELCTGARFGAADEGSEPWLRARAAGHLPEPTAELPEPWQGILRRALAPAAEQRFPSGAALVDALPIA